MKIIKGDLILTENTEFSESLKVEGSIKGYFNLSVSGNINAWDIDARNINAWDIDALDINARDINARNINAWDIDARNINAWDINARNIDAWDINARNIDVWNVICEKRIKKTETARTICRIYIKNKSKLEKKEREIN